MLNEDVMSDEYTKSQSNARIISPAAFDEQPNREARGSLEMLVYPTQGTRPSSPPPGRTILAPISLGSTVGGAPPRSIDSPRYSPRASRGSNLGSHELFALSEDPRSPESREPPTPKQLSQNESCQVFQEVDVNGEQWGDDEEVELWRRGRTISRAGKLGTRGSLRCKLRRCRRLVFSDYQDSTESIQSNT